MAALLEGHGRQLRFVLVGGFCFLVQLVILGVLAHLGVHRVMANVVGFVVSAQVNFLLSSRFTWSDRSADGRWATLARLVSYNGTCLTALAVNTVLFTLSYQIAGTVLAAMLGVLGGMVGTYLLCDQVVFPQRRQISLDGVRLR